MVDEQQADSDKSLKTTASAPAAPQGDDWGADWESAFQAEEFLVDETGGDTDLAETGQEGDDDFTPNEEESRGDLTHEDGKTRLGAGVTLAPQPAALAAKPSPIARLISRFFALPMPIRLGIPVALLLLLAGATLFRLLGRPAQTPPAPLTQDLTPIASEVTPALPPAEPAAEPVAVDTVPQQAEKSHTIWPFTPFIIPVVDEETKATIFVSVDLSLVIALNNEKDAPPLARKPFVRDTIFQFFVNRPLYDLRRYNLAHDEMSNQLLEWLRKQWADGEISAVTINSYKLD